MDLVKDLVQQVKKELVEVGSKYTDKENYVFYQWMEVEYKNYMLIGRVEFLTTLSKFEQAYPNYQPLIKILQDYINEYGATQAYYRVALELCEGVTENE